MLKPDLSNSPTLPAPKRISISDLVEQAQRAVNVVSEVRGMAVAPDSRKQPPVLSGADVARLCSIDKSHLNYRITKGDLPTGQVRANGVRREFTLAEARAWTAAFGVAPKRPAGAKAVTVAIANFKGGSTKTTTALTLSQGLSLRGHRVLLVDLDPQGSVTTLCGVLPDTEVEDDKTIAPLCYGEQESVQYAIRSTYWDGLDLIPASPTLFSAEFALPARQVKERGFRFWDVLNVGLESVRADYDLIVIDTPPALSYLTINALMAADGMVVPMPPNALDFASSAQFWNLFSDLAASIEESRGIRKEFDFIHVLLSKVDKTDGAMPFVRSLIAATYAGKVLPVEIPKTNVTTTSAAEFKTVYDLSKYEGSYKTYERAREAYDRFVELTAEVIAQAWARQVVEVAPTALAESSPQDPSNGNSRPRRRSRARRSDPASSVTPQVAETDAQLN